MPCTLMSICPDTWNICSESDKVTIKETLKAKTEITVITSF